MVPGTCWERQFQTQGVSHGERANSLQITEGVQKVEGGGRGGPSMGMDMMGNEGTEIRES